MKINAFHDAAYFSEPDTCREYVTPAIQAAGWGDSPFEIAEQRSFTDGRIFLTMATGTGKTPTAFHIVWKMWNSGWNKDADPTRKTRVLFLADRNILVDGWHGGTSAKSIHRHGKFQWLRFLPTAAALTAKTQQPRKTSHTYRLNSLSPISWTKSVRSWRSWSKCSCC